MKLLDNKKIDTNKYELTVSVDAEAFEEGIQKVFRKQSKKISVPGFRQGKAPRKMVEKLYGESVFFEDAVNELYPSALAEAITEAKLEVVAPPELEVKNISKEDGFEFVAVCVVKPEVEIKDYKGIKAEKVEKPVSDKEVDERIAAVQERNARQIEITDRAAAKGDTVQIDFEGFADGKAFDGGKAEKFDLELGSGQFIPGFEEQIEGRKIGDEFDVNVKFPEDYQAEELKGKEAVFKCKLHEIRAKELPALDDEFAKDVSEFDTLAEYKADMKAKMQANADREADREYENKIIDAVIENMTVVVPDEMIEARVDEMVRDFDYRLQSQGMNLDMYLKYSGMDIPSFRMTYKDQAEKQVKIRLALEKIVEIEGITVSEQELEDEYKKVAEAYKMELDQVKAAIPQGEFEKDIAVNKAIDIVKSNAVNEKPAAKKTAAKKPAAKKTEGDEKPAAKKATAKKAASDEKPAAKKTTAKKPAAKKDAE